MTHFAARRCASAAYTMALCPYYLLQGDIRLKPRLHDKTGCQTGLITGLTTG